MPIWRRWWRHRSHCRKRASAPKFVARHEGLLRVEGPRSAARVGRSGVGASRPFQSLLAMFSLLSEARADTQVWPREPPLVPPRTCRLTGLTGTGDHLIASSIARFSPPDISCVADPIQVKREAPDVNRYLYPSIGIQPVAGAAHKNDARRFLPPQGASVSSTMYWG